MDISSTSCLNLDPLFFERADDYFPSDGEKNSTIDIKLNVHSSKVLATLYFPVADLRTEEQRIEEEGLEAVDSPSKLRPETLLFEIEDFTLESKLSTSTKIQCDAVKVRLMEPDKTGVLIIDARRNAVEAIEFDIRTGPYAAAPTDLEKELERSAFFEGGMEDSIYISNSKNQGVEAFQVKRKVIKGKDNDSEPVIAPSDRENATSFLELARANTDLFIEIQIPTIDVMLDKGQLELVYNRFGNDMVLWRPRRKTNAKKADEGKDTIRVLKPTQPTYYTCKSGLADSIDSESSFHSVDGAPSSKFLNTAAISVTGQEVSFKALLDNKCTQVVTGQKVLLGVVVGLENDSVNTIFICGDKVALTHDGSKVITSNTYTDSTSSLNMTFEIRLESSEVKKLKIALQLCDAALHSLEFDIFKQFWDVINITDEPVLGYNPPCVQTELHISLMSGAIALDGSEIRPALFTFDDVYITSMVIASTSQTLFRFIVEEGSLYFSRNRRKPKSLKDCICVLDSGLTDLNLKITSDDRIEFKISNNVINVRVCSDSLTALCDLVVFYATPPAGTAASPDVGVGEMSPIAETEVNLPDGELIADALSDVVDDNDDNASVNSGSLRSCDYCDQTNRIGE